MWDLRGHATRSLLLNVAVNGDDELELHLFFTLRCFTEPVRSEVKRELHLDMRWWTQLHRPKNGRVEDLIALTVWCERACGGCFWVAVRVLNVPVHNIPYFIRVVVPGRLTT